MAAIETAYGEQTADQTETTTTYSDVQAVTSGSWVGSADYFLIVLGQFGGGDAAILYKLKLLHGSTEFKGSEHIVERRGAGHYYSYFAKYTPNATPEDVKLQHAVGSTPATVTTYTSVILAIRLDADLTEGKDWAYGEDDDTASPTGLTQTFTSFATTGSFTPDNANDKWMVVCFSSLDPESITKNVEMRMDRDSETETQPEYSTEGEDQPNDEYGVAIFRGFDLTAAAHTFTTQCRNDGESSGNHVWSSVGTLRLDAFEDSNYVWTEGEITLATDDVWEEVAGTANFTPQTAGPFVIIGSFIADQGGGAGARIQIGGTTHPTGFDDNNLYFDKTLNKEVNAS